VKQIRGQGLDKIAEEFAAEYAANH